MQTLIKTLALTLAVTNANADVTIARAKNPDVNFRGTEVITLYGNEFGDGMAPLFNPGNRDLIITQICTYSNGMVDTPHGQHIDADTCQTFTPGLVMPRNQTINYYGSVMVNGVIR